MKLDSLNDFVQRQMTAPLRFALEARAPWEHGAALAAQPLLAMLPKGDGHPVLVLPLMFGNDLSTLGLRGFLKARGYAASAWDLGVNLGPRSGVFDACLERLRALRARHGRPVSLIGWSLGGLFARALALEAPDDVRLVISLGTPISADPAPSQVWRLYEQITGDPMGLPSHLADLAQPLPVPSTSIFSRSDGIVPWQDSIQPAAPQAESIEVESSHLGLGAHPLTLLAIADRLALPPGQWRPFERNGLKSWLYRDPARDGWI
jgi:pimeloyl-ACP methyl ester carboxylesterase